MLHSPSNGNRILLQKVCKTAFATVAFTMQQLSLSRKTWSESRRLKGNMCERMVCVGGEATTSGSCSAPHDLLLHILQRNELDR